MPNRRSSRRAGVRGGPSQRRVHAARPATPAGRAWINGREVGGTDPRWAHLTRSHD